MPKIDSRANVNIRMDGTKMVIEVETDSQKVNAQPSTSGKTLTVATTGGYRWGLGSSGEFGVNLTVSRRP